MDMVSPGIIIPQYLTLVKLLSCPANRVDPIFPKSPPAKNHLNYTNTILKINQQPDRSAKDLFRLRLFARSSIMTDFWTPVFTGVTTICMGINKRVLYLTGPKPNRYKRVRV